MGYPPAVDEPTGTRDRWPAEALVVSAVFAALALPLTDLLLDDTYITLRYGRSLAEGLGPVFNPGEWVEGFTSPAWMLVAALVHLVPGDPPTTMVVLGALASLATLLLVARGAGGLGGGPRGGGLAAALMVAHAGFFAWAFTGMDTALFTLVATATAGALVARRARVAGVLGGLLCWVRPEGWLLAPVALAAGTGSRRERFEALLPCGVGLGSLFLVRGIAYGDLLPNTFYAKVPMGAVQLAWGAEYLLAGAWGAGFGLLHFLALPTLLRWARGEPGARGAAALVGAVHLATLLEGGDTFPLDRFLVPALPLLALAAAGTLARIDLRGPRGRALEVALVLAIGLASARGPRLEPAFVFRAQTRLYEAMAPALLAAEPEARSLATPAAGALPYLTRYRTIDTVGLTDAVIARSPPDLESLRAHQRGDPGYVLGREPDLVVPGPIALPPGPVRDPRGAPLEVLVGRPHAFPSERGMWRDPRFLAGWEARALDLPGGGRFLYFRRRQPRSASN